jgi:mono/diheme cytochrome c family protein
VYGSEAMQIFTPYHTLTRAGIAIVALIMAELSPEKQTIDTRAAARMREAVR